MRVPVQMIFVGRSTIFFEGLCQLMRGSSFEATRVAPGDLEASPQVQACDLFLVAYDGSRSAVEEAVATIKSVVPEARVTLLLGHEDDDLANWAIRLGAQSYLTEEVISGALASALEVIARGAVILPAEAMAAMPLRPIEALPSLPMNHPTMSRLSPREMGVLQGLVGGNSNKVIARRLDIAEATVKVHIKAVLRKVRVQNRTQAAIWAMRNGVTEGGQQAAA